jgi:tripartite-type tricarboxylate transporter receptor subunit TctC
VTILRSCTTKLLTLICLLCLFAAAGWAQNYPVKVVRYLVPGSPGSGDDVVGRIVAAGLSQVFGQQVIVDNRAGAGGNIGAEIASKAPADGYTLFHLNITQALNVSLYRNLPYDLMRDFTPVTQSVTAPAIALVHPSLPVKSIGELIKLAKAKPRSINYASAGTGTTTFLAAELFKGQTGVNMVHVPYKGGGEAQTSLLSGETSVYFATIGTVLSYIKQGRLRALAVTTANRVPLLPEYPTIAESGVPGYAFTNWYGLMVPAKTPKEIVATINAAAVSTLRNPAVIKRFNDLVFLPVGNQPEEFGRILESEIATLAKVVKDLGLRAD